jgi:hypothetical protein
MKLDRPITSGDNRMSEQHERPLAQLLIQIGTEKIQRDGKTTPRMELLARITWDLVVDGFIRFPDHPWLGVTPHDWVALLKWLHELIDGKPQTSKPSAKTTAAPPRDLPIPHVAFPLTASRK